MTAPKGQVHDILHSQYIFILCKHWGHLLEETTARNSPTEMFTLRFAYWIRPLETDELVKCSHCTALLCNKHILHKYMAAGIYVRTLELHCARKARTLGWQHRRLPCKSWWSMLKSDLLIDLNSVQKQIILSDSAFSSVTSLIGHAGWMMTL